jgi:MFS family permease
VQHRGRHGRERERTWQLLHVSPAGIGAPAHPWGATLLVGIGQFASWGALYYSYAALAPSLAAGIGVPRRTVALAFSVTLLVAGLAARAVGRWLDRGGARPVLLAGAVLGPAALLAIASAGDGVTLWIAFLALGLAHAHALYEPAFRAVVTWFPVERDRTRALLLVTCVGGMAAPVFVPLTASLVLSQGWRTAAAVLALLLAAVVIPGAWHLPHADGSPRHEAARVVPRTPQGARRLAAVFGLQAFVASAVVVALLWHLLESGTPTLRASFVAGLAGAAQVPGRLLVGALQAGVSDSWRVTVSLGAQAAGIVAIAAGPGVAVPAGVVLFGAASGAMTLERAVIPARWFGTRSYGLASGTLAAAGLGGRAAAPFAVELAHAQMSYGSVLLALVPVLLVGAVVFATTSRVQRAARR